MRCDEEPFSVSVDESPAGAVLRMAGDINQDAAARLHEETLRLGSGSPITSLDWSEAQYLSGGALQVLLALSLSRSQAGTPLQVVADNSEIRRLVELAGLAEYFPAGQLPL